MSWKKPISAPYWPRQGRWTRRPKRWASMHRPCTASASSTTCERHSMKLAMKLRTRLFLSISALITVALLGLLLGLVSVMQMAGTQEALVRNNFVTLDLGLKLRQTLGDQLIIMLGEKADPAAFEASKQHYFQLLDEGIAHEQSGDGAQHGFSQAKTDYLSFLQAYSESRDPTHVLRGNEALTEKFNMLRNGLISEHKRALDNIND